MLPEASQRAASPQGPRPRPRCDLEGSWPDEDHDWTRADALLAEALELEPSARERFLQRVRATDPALGERLAELLEASRVMGGFLEEGAVAAVAGSESESADDRPADPADAPADGRYRLVRRLGRGGMATVYLAERADGRVSGPVAVKVLRKGLDTEEVIRHFLAERQILATLSHPSVAVLLDAGETGDGRPYLVTEYVEGRALDDYCAALSPSLSRRLDLFRTICAAVQHAHAHLVVHRDLKPSNVIVRDDGTVKLLDFGIAKILEPDGSGDGGPHTRTGVRLYSPEYASPEQLRGARITTATDVYQLGCLLYVLLTGRPPHRREGGWLQGGGSEALSDPRPPAVIARELGQTLRIPRDLDAIALKAVSADHLARYQSVEELAEEIDRLKAGLPVRARAPTPLYRARRFVLRNRLASATALAALLSASWYWRTLAVHAEQLASERDRATAEAATAREVAGFVGDIFGQVNPRTERGDTLSARTLLDRAAAGLSAPGTNPDVRASLLAAVGGAYSRLGLFPDALPLYQEAAGLLEGRPAGDPERIHVLERLGAALQATRQLEPAREAMAAVVQHRRAQLAASPGDLAVETALASSLATLAFAGGEDGDEESRERAAREAIQLLEAHAAPDPRVQASARRMLAGVLERRQERGEAEALYRAVIEGLEALPPDQGDVVLELANARNSLANLFVRGGREEEALDLFERAFDTFDEVLGPGHSVTLSALMNVVSAGAEVDPAGRVEIAQEWVRRERAAGTARPERLVSALRQLAFHTRMAGDLTAAAAAAEEAVAIAADRDLSRMPAAFLAQLELGRVLRSAGDAEGAAAVLEAALMPSSLSGEVSASTVADARSTFAELLETLGRSEEAALQRAQAARLRDSRRGG